MHIAYPYVLLRCHGCSPGEARFVAIVVAQFEFDLVVSSRGAFPIPFCLLVCVCVSLRARSHRIAAGHSTAREEPITSDVVANYDDDDDDYGAVLLPRHENEIYVSHVINFKRGVASLK